MMLAITVGEGLKRPQGRAAPFDPPPVAGLAERLRAQPQKIERWWSVHSWLNDYRAAANWRSSVGVAVDLDYKIADETPPAETIARLTLLATTNKLPGSLFHLTPHGARVVFVYDSPCDHREMQISASKGAASLIDRALSAADLFDYEIDVCTWDLGRLYFTPNAIAKGVPRSAEIVVLRETPYDTNDLTLEEPPQERPAPKPIPISRDYNDLIEAWNSDHPREYPRKPSECPACKDHASFHELPGDADRWYCFSTDHDGVGLRGENGWHGDALDLEAHERGLKTVDVLKHDGYIKPKRPPRTSEEAAHVDGNLALEPVALIDQHRRPFRNNSYLTALMIVRENARDVLGGRKVELNEMTGQVELSRVPLRDEDVTAVRAEAERLFVGGVDKQNREVGLKLSLSDVDAAVRQVASECSYHPVRDYLNGLKWDGVERIAHVAGDILNAKETPLTRTLIRRFFISAVARPMNPGCKVDTVLILVGKQGILKSSFFRVLADPWFIDTVIDISTDATRAYQTLRRAWMLEWAELESLFRARDASAVKAFLSSSSDTYIPKYGRNPVEAKRSGIIVGTINPDEFLSDETGSRRFWPVRCGEIVLSLATAQRDQLWAEAVSLYRAGEPWWLTGEEEDQLQGVHDEHRVRDAWEERVLSWAEGQAYFTTGDVLAKPLEKQPGQWTRADEMRVSRILKMAGYERKTDPQNKKLKSWRHCV